MNAAGILLVSPLLAVNGYWTFRVLRDGLSERHHKIVYILTVWLAPVVGAVFVWLMMIRESEKGPLGYGESADSFDAANARSSSS